LPGLSEERRPVFPGGAAILIEVMASLGIDTLYVSDGALREGLLYDLVGRLSNEDARDRTVRSMESRFNIDVRQADRVEQTAMRLYEQVAERWSLATDLHANLLRWAARLHEIGLHIAHSKYHHHGAYLLENADMPGFPEVEQRVLARLVGEQRGRLNRQFFADIPEKWEVPARNLTLLLRLAVLFNRGRADQAEQDVRCSGTAREFTVRLALGREENPLTWADLEREQSLLNEIGISLGLVEPT
jgi:exopolyphosphatase/guanosine-5'-triphosphate,3'-diphosphate pyrophosphatase